MVSKVKKITNLATRKFGELTQTEKKLFEAVVAERSAIYDFKTNGANTAVSHGQAHVLQADRIIWLCTDSMARELLASFGIRIFKAKIEKSLDLQFVTLDIPLVLQECFFDKPIVLEQARIRFIDFSRSRVPEVRAEGIKVEGHVYLSDSFYSSGKVNFSGARIGGDFNCSGGGFHSSFLAENKALIVQNSRIEGSVFLDRGFYSKGVVDFSGTSIDGILDCQGGKFENPAASSLRGQGAKIGQAVLLRSGFSSAGEVNFLCATIGSDLDCDGGEFINPSGDALIAQGAAIKNNVLFRYGFRAEGRIGLVDAKIDGTLWIRDIKKSSTMKLDLRSARVKVLGDQSVSWPEKENLDIDGFVYEKISRHSTIDPQERLAWLRLQPKDTFSLQPYEQLAQVFKNSGSEEPTRQILIAKQNDLRRHGHLDYFSKSINYILGCAIEHGYRPQKIFVFITFFTILGAEFFGYGYSENAMSPSLMHSFNLDLSSREMENYPRFNPVFYSLDVLIPVIDLHQQRYWLPNANRDIGDVCIDGDNLCVSSFGSLLQHFFWLQIIIGWMLTSIGVAGFAGLIRRF